MKLALLGCVWSAGYTQRVPELLLYILGRVLFRRTREGHEHLQRMEERGLCKD